ncbi:MAG TPA: redox-sensitive transcriptional activator SoxR [Trueperaceae bacterium]|nr:redox-sensitive transcriptional activator SoxR [Trueperaceae bacterium]
MALPSLITIGELSLRTGVATSALRFYEEKDLIRSERTSGNQRRFARATIRRVAVVRAAQRCGISLDEVQSVLANLPADRMPTVADWRDLSEAWRGRLDERISALEGLRDKLTGCIGCGCLSLDRCWLLNPDDEAGRSGVGARFLER